MFVELHIIQNFAPSNLNRDDTGAPKDCQFGGYRRARISSQALKRAIRMTFGEENLLPEESRARRTKRIAGALVERLVASGKDAVAAAAVVEAAIQGIGLSFEKPKEGDTEKKTQYLLFLGQREINALADVCLAHWDTLVDVAPNADAASERDAKKAKKANKAALPKQVQLALLDALDGRSADVALFGRMLADLPEKNIDAASQVAHAISTHRVATEFDFYTAVDDLKPDDTAGADMLGTVEFNSACFYRYSNIDVDQLIENLGGDVDLARTTVEAFLWASIHAIPTGKQNSMAAQNPPSFVMAVVRDRGLWSLANAFVNPVAPAHDGDLIERSVDALEAYWSNLVRVYGGELRGTWCVNVNPRELGPLEELHVDTFEELVDAVVTAAFAEAETGAAA
ncbi:type I-E CRISPR-associated protein Cas7/Cse4/CasC [Sphaerobacter thermophilus]|uniref:CRISPR-associated protein, Cse4 family n=1 Tax=Sphaerobacter thermophilus (strain ATCC 49802 / DSM 20745 / KCCM 41009 / NCIMB 13125 / S 6022) TaxID=479434 RepID=D1CAJ1_SPHTD|nr:type I-E CRISPR-associated protein Cas7/Cse4/CasC [Sphaerobacter thermophilus]ACZ40834.1 CRISPR-associated protein, Cse4 family [Sphaerobacter thermophilus DSM 20745]